MVKLAPQYVVDDRGSRTSVILPIQDYENLLKELRILRARQGDKEAFLALDPVMREAILAEQADKFKHYEGSQDWLEQQTHDLYDYDE